MSDVLCYGSGHLATKLNIWREWSLKLATYRVKPVDPVPIKFWTPRFR